MRNSLSSQSKIRNNYVEYWLIFIAVFGGSTVNVLFCNIPVNKLCLIPLLVYSFLSGNFYKPSINRLSFCYFFYYISAVFSCIVGVLYCYDNRIEYSEFKSKEILYILQYILLYIPLFFCLNKINYCLFFIIKSLVLVAKINACWAVVQFFGFYVYSFDLNLFISQDIFQSFLSLHSQYGDFGSSHIRVSGINNDSAYFCLIVLIGFILTKSYCWKLLFLLVVVLSSSRAGIVSAFFICFLYLFSLFKKKYNRNKMIYCCGYLLCLFILFVSLFLLDVIKYQFDYIVYKFYELDSANRSTGTNRHFTYFYNAIVAWLNEPLILKIFGFGPTHGGCALFLFGGLDWAYFSEGMEEHIWAIESDFPELLLGHGLCSLLLYIYLFILYKKLIVQSNCYLYDLDLLKHIILLILIMGIMYDYMESTLVFLILLGLSFVKKQSHYRIL